MMTTNQLYEKIIELSSGPNGPLGGTPIKELGVDSKTYANLCDHLFNYMRGNANHVTYLEHKDMNIYNLDIYLGDKGIIFKRVDIWLDTSLDEDIYPIQSPQVDKNNQP